MSDFDQYKELLQEKLSLFLSLSTLKRENAWLKSLDKDGLKIHTKKDSQGVTLIRSEGLISHPPSELFSIFWNDAVDLKKVDDSIADYRILSSSKDGTKVIAHSKLKPAPLVTPRDIVFIIAYMKQKSGYIIYGASINYPKEVGYIRAHCNVWGWILEENTKGTHAINVNYTDLAGRIPSFVVKPVLIKEQGYLIKRAEDFLNKKKETIVPKPKL